MGVELITRKDAVAHMVAIGRKCEDARANWLCRHKPQMAKLVFKTALGSLPDRHPQFSNVQDVGAFIEEIQYETISELRGTEYVVGMRLDSVSQTRWQWVLERAIGELASLVAQEFLNADGKTNVK